MKATLKRKVEIEHLPYYLLKPENLICLSEEYTKEALLLLAHLKSNPNGPIVLARIQSDGSITKKTIVGIAKDVCENGFTFVSNETFDGKYDRPQKTFIRVDNPLGLVPFLPYSRIENPYENRLCEETKNFLGFLEETKKLFRECLTEIHKAILCYRLANNRKEIIDCEIEKVNESNLEITQFRSIVYEKGIPISSIIGEQKKVMLNIATEHFLQKATVIFGEKHKISPYDDED